MGANKNKKTVNNTFFKNQKSTLKIRTSTGNKHKNIDRKLNIGKMKC